MFTENNPTAALQVERSTVTKLVITGAPSLDPITVFLEDLAPCKGKITVSCWGKSWTAYWGAARAGPGTAAGGRMKRIYLSGTMALRHRVRPHRRGSSRYSRQTKMAATAGELNGKETNNT